LLLNSFEYSTDAKGLVNFAIILDNSPFVQNASTVNFMAKAIEVLDNEETHMKQPTAKLVC